MWIYGICDRPSLPAPQQPGLADEPLGTLGDGELVAVFTRHDRDLGDPTPAALWTHERVVEALMAERTVVPMRFGSTVAGEPALRQLLSERRDALTAALTRVRGRVELSVRAIGATEVDAPRSGRDYLLGRLQESRRAAALHEPLAGLASDAVQRAPHGTGELLRGAYLVEQADVARFSAGVERLQDAHREMTIHCTGPWPAYSFVG